MPKKKKIWLQVKDLDGGAVSRPIEIWDLLKNNQQIEFPDGGHITLKDLLFWSGDYEIQLVNI